MPAKASERPKPKAKDDPFDLHHRTELVYDWLLDDWEKNPDMKNRTDALKIMQVGGMFLTRNIKLKDVADEQHAGSAVKKYSGAFRVKAADGKAPPKPALVTYDGGDDDAGDDAA